MKTEERLAALEQREKEDQQFRENLIQEIANEYDFTLEIAKLCVDEGWADGHAYGYHEVRVKSKIAADFAYDVLAIAGNS